MAVRHLLFVLILTFANACVSAGIPSPAPDAARVTAVVETESVPSTGDAADDPAIWINASDPAQSRILGTDKRAGLYVYDLSGAVTQFLPAGQLNNVDVRQNVAIDRFSGDIAAASNRTDDTIVLFSISREGRLSEFARIPSGDPEPYGLCLGAPTDGRLLAFLAQKTGDLIVFDVESAATGREIARIKLETQLEGCVFDDAFDRLYIGEEDRGIWRADYAAGAFGAPALVDEVGRAGRLVADVEGLALYRKSGGDGYLIASSQGDSAFAVYERQPPNRFIGRFAIHPGTSRSGAAIDGTADTDGIEATSVDLGPAFPAGLFIAQDGYNGGRRDGQNYKIVDWRDIETALGF